KDLEWLDVPIDVSNLHPDLTPIDFDVKPALTAYGWGQALDTPYHFRNQGSLYAKGPFTTGVYLSTDKGFDKNDFLLHQELCDGIAAGATLGGEFDVTLPQIPPAGFAA